MNASEIFVSVDIETSGPVPGLFILLSIGACLVRAPAVRFYAELRHGDEFRRRPRHDENNF